MQTGVAVLALAAVIGWSTLGLGAHHAFSDIFALEQRVTIEGEVVELVVRNPHSYVHVLAADRSDQLRRWAIEWSGSARSGPLQRLKVGDRIVATGMPGRDPAAFRLLVRAIRRPSDGWQWEGGAR